MRRRTASRRVPSTRSGLRGTRSPGRAEPLYAAAVTIEGPGAVSTGVNAATASLDAPRLLSARPAFAEVAAEQLDAAYRYLVYLTGDRSAAEDLTADTFEKAVRTWRRLDPRRRPA